MTIEQIITTAMSIQAIGGGAAAALVWFRLGRLGQEIRNHKEGHEALKEDFEKIKKHCPLCTIAKEN